jgi:hypothetical protein
MNVPKYDESLVKCSGVPPEPKPLLSAKEKVAADVIVPAKPDLTPTTSRLIREKDSESGHISLNLSGSDIADRPRFLFQAIGLGLGSEDSCVMEAPSFEPQPLRLWPDADERNWLLDVTQQIIDGNKFVGENYSNAAALAKFHGQRDDTERAAHEGKLNEAPFQKSLDAMQNDCRARRLAAEKVWVSLTAEAAPIMRKAIERTVSILHGALVYLEFIGREEAASFGMTWQPSPLWKAIAHTLVKFSLKKDPAPGVWVLPTHHLDGLLSIDL